MFEELYQKLAQNNLIDETGSLILERYEDGSIQTVDKLTFETFFGDVENQYSYEGFMGIHAFQWGDPPQTLTYTGEQLGYKKYFDEWKAKGILV